jgi:hypothetical protein
MKQQFFKIRNILTGLTLSACMVAIAMPASAKPKKNEINTSAIQPIVKYIGSDPGSSLFSVKMNTETSVYFQLVIKDGEGNELFRQGYESSKFEQYFKMVNEGTGDEMNLSFSIEILPGGEVYTFQASSPSPLVKDVIITKQ